MMVKIIVRENPPKKRPVPMPSPKIQPTDKQKAKSNRKKWKKEEENAGN